MLVPVVNGGSAAINSIVENINEIQPLKLKPEFSRCHARTVKKIIDKA